MVKEVPATHRLPTVHPYSVTDPIPAPEAVESNSDTAWDLWEDSRLPPDTARDPSFDNTVPDQLRPIPATPFPKRRP